VRGPHRCSKIPSLKSKQLVSNCHMIQG
jgi:hypothetical protein